MDNYYTSPELFLSLYVKNVSPAATHFRASGPLLACSWKDIIFVTTIHVAEMSLPTKVKKYSADGTQADLTCPRCLPDYQKYMRGVDRGDQLMSYYNVGRRSRKWWKRIFYYLIEVSFLNAYM